LVMVMMVGCWVQEEELSASFDASYSTEPVLEDFGLTAEVAEKTDSQSNLNDVDITNESQNEALFENEFCDTSVYYTEGNPVQEKYWLCTVDELGEIIVASGMFWEEWWNSTGPTGRFSYQNTGSWDDNHAEIYVPLLPTSGFGSLDDIRSYLMKYYSETWVDSMLSHTFPPFIEYNDMLFIHIARNSSARPNWETAIHILICRVDYLIFVESVVSYWDFEVGYEFELTHSFTFIDGRIDSTSICPIWLEWL